MGSPRSRTAPTSLPTRRRHVRVFEGFSDLSPWKSVVRDGGGTGARTKEVYPGTGTDPQLVLDPHDAGRVEEV